MFIDHYHLSSLSSLAPPLKNIHQLGELFVLQGIPAQDCHLCLVLSHPEVGEVVDGGPDVLEELLQLVCVQVLLLILEK